MIEHLGDNPSVFRRCSYCLRTKTLSDFNLEHIWPDALGGNALPRPWKTENVCSRCNELSGRYVDGEFIKSWFVAHERSNAAREYLAVKQPQNNWLPLSYMGVMPHPNLDDKEVAEVWLGPCGDHIVHIRPKQEPEWDVYAGGKPTRKRIEWGSAYLIVCSNEPFWIWSAVNSFHRHFRRAERFVLNMNRPEGYQPPFLVHDPLNPDHVRKERIARSLELAAQTSQMVQLQSVIKTDLSGRFLVKVALGIGREFLGDTFLDSPYADALRGALWERDFGKRSNFPIKGTGYLSDLGSMPGMSYLRWPGAWVIWVHGVGDILALSIVAPSGHVMMIQVCDEASLVQKWANKSPQGQIFVVVPSIEQAVGPIGGADFFAHQLGEYVDPNLAALNDKRTSLNMLPPCRL